MSDVLSLPGTSGKWKKLFAVQSKSRPDVHYVVAQDSLDRWGCSCPAWIYHTPRHDCKHIATVKATLGRSARLEAFTDADIEARPKLKKTLSRFALVEI